MLVSELLVSVLAQHPVPWRLGNDDEIIVDALGHIVVSDGTGAFIAFSADVGALIVTLVNAHGSALINERERPKGARQTPNKDLLGAAEVIISPLGVPHIVKRQEPTE